MKTHPVLFTALSAILCSSAPAAVVLTNLTGTIDTSSLVKGTGGFITPPFSYGFEFTVAGGIHYFDSVSISIGNHAGTVPLSVDLFSSPSGPDTAVFLTSLTGPSQPVNQVATYVPPTTLLLNNGSTYFVRLSVIGSASTYGINRTSTAATGTWGMGNFFTRTGTGIWNDGGFSPETLMEISATPVPEPGTALLSGFSLLLLLRRRR